MKAVDRLLEKRPIVEHYLGEEPNRLSACSFVNIFAWQDFFHFDLKVIQDSLCVFARHPAGCFLYLPPLGKKITAEIIEECFDIMEEANRGSGVTRIENVSDRQLALFPAQRFKYFKKGYDYCYFKKDIVFLRGNSYKSKRASYNQFINGAERRYVPYEEAMLGECLNLYHRWADQRRQAYQDGVYQQMLEENRSVHELLLRHARPLGLTGRVVWVGGRIEAYSFGYAVNQDVFCVLLEIASLDIKGLAVYLFREFCRDKALERFKFINVMDDFGMENMKATKLSFRPSILIPSWVVSRRRLKESFSIG